MTWLIRTGFLSICGTEEDSGIDSAKKQTLKERQKNYNYIQKAIPCLKQMLLKHSLACKCSLL